MMYYNYINLKKYKLSRYCSTKSNRNIYDIVLFFFYFKVWRDAIMLAWQINDSSSPVSITTISIKSGNDHHLDRAHVEVNIYH